MNKSYDKTSRNLMSTSVELLPVFDRLDFSLSPKVNQSEVLLTSYFSPVFVDFYNWIAKELGAGFPNAETNNCAVGFNNNTKSFFEKYNIHYEPTAEKSIALCVVDSAMQRLIRHFNQLKDYVGSMSCIRQFLDARNEVTVKSFQDSFCTSRYDDCGAQPYQSALDYTRGMDSGYMDHWIDITVDAALSDPKANITTYSTLAGQISAQIGASRQAAYRIKSWLYNTDRCKDVPSILDAMINGVRESKKTTQDYFGRYSKKKEEYDNYLICELAEGVIQASASRTFSYKADCIKAAQNALLQWKVFHIGKENLNKKLNEGQVPSESVRLQVLGILSNLFNGGNSNGITSN